MSFIIGFMRHASECNIDIIVENIPIFPKVKVSQECEFSNVTTGSKPGKLEWLIPPKTD